jgi:hypothetical protein
MSDSASVRLRKLMRGRPSRSVLPSPHDPADRPPPSPGTPTAQPASVAPAASPTPQPGPASGPVAVTLSDARLYLQELRGKMARVAEEFAQGQLNRAQFQEIYVHYQRQRVDIEQAMYDIPGSDVWRDAVMIGLTSMLRRRNAARILGYAICDTSTDAPLASVGEFQRGTRQLALMLSKLHSASHESPGGRIRGAQIEGGRWLCSVTGQFTTLFVVYSTEPARLQLTLAQDLHRDFETANRSALIRGEGAEAAFQFIKLWAFDQSAV